MFASLSVVQWYDLGRSLSFKFSETVIANSSGIWLEKQLQSYLFQRAASSR